MKNMLTKGDLKAIGGIVDEKIEARLKPLDKKIDDVLEAVNDGFTDMETRFDKRFTGVESSLTNVERKLDRTDGKVNTLVNILQKKHVITEDEKRVVLA